MNALLTSLGAGAGAGLGSGLGSGLSTVADVFDTPRRLLWQHVVSPLFGQELKGGSDLLASLGADPEDTLTSLGGMGLDMVSDPLTWLGGLGGLKAGARVGGMADRALPGMLERATTHIPLPPGPRQVNPLAIRAMQGEGVSESALQALKGGVPMGAIEDAAIAGRGVRNQALAEAAQVPTQMRQARNAGLGEEVARLGKTTDDLHTWQRSLDTNLAMTTDMLHEGVPTEQVPELIRALIDREIAFANTHPGRRAYPPGASLARDITLPANRQVFDAHHNTLMSSFDTGEHNNRLPTLKRQVNATNGLSDLLIQVMYGQGGSIHG